MAIQLNPFKTVEWDTEISIREQSWSFPSIVTKQQGVHFSSLLCLCTSEDTEDALRNKCCSPLPPHGYFHICWESDKIFRRSAYLQTMSFQPITGISVSSHSQANHKVICHFSRRHFTGMKNKSIPKALMQEAHLKTIQDWIYMPVAHVACKITEAK